MGGPTELRSRVAGDLVVVLGAALVVRVGYLAAMVGRPPLSDADQYLDIARNVSAGNGVAMQWPQLHVHATAFRPPLYPVLLGGWINLLGDSPTVARALNVLIGLGVVALATLFARILGGRVGGLVTGGLVAVYPPLLANDATTLAEPLGLLLLLATLLAVSRRRWWAVGLAGGLLALTKPAAQGILVLLVVTAVALVAMSGGDRHWGRAAAAGGIVAATGAMVILPWVVRNRIELGTTSLVTSNGFTLTAIYAPVAQKQGSFLDPVYGSPYQSLDERLLRWDEGRWNDVLVERGLDGLRDRPSYLLRVVWGNLGRWFELTPAANDDAERLDGRHLRLRRLSLPLFYAVTVLGAAGLVVGLRTARPGRGTLALLVATCGCFTLVSLALVATPRLRAPVDLACCVGCGLLATWWRERRLLDPARNSDECGLVATHGVTSRRQSPQRRATR